MDSEGLKDSGGLWRNQPEGFCWILKDSGRILKDSEGFWRILEDSGGFWRDSFGRESFQELFSTTVSDGRAFRRIREKSIGFQYGVLARARARVRERPTPPCGDSNGTIF